MVGRSAEIDADPALRTYALVLSLLHALTGVAWFSYKHIASLVTAEDRVCWPFFPACGEVRALLSERGAVAAVAVYIGLGLAAAGAFALRKPRPAFGLFVLAGVVGTLIYCLDYRLRFNQTYMFSWVALAFVLAPRRRAHAVQTLVALFYFWAGTLKTNHEWTSGAALYAKPLFVPAALVPAACVYVLVLELLLVWGLFAPRPRVRWAVYAQLVLFHVVSWNVVGYFYPLLMLGLTAIYPLVWLRTPHETLTWRELRVSAPALAIAALFSLFQLLPSLYPGDTAVTGEGRLFALHMFDARVACSGGAYLRSRKDQRSFAPLINEKLDVRTRCDPIVLVAEASRLCALLASRPEPPRVDLVVDAKRETAAQMTPLLRVPDLCAHPVEYSLWHHNAWIAPAGDGARTRSESAPATTNSAMKAE